MCYYTTKKYISGAVQGLMLTTSTWHLIIYIRVLWFCNLKFIFRHLYLNRNLVELDHFIPLLAYWLHQNSYNWLIWWFIDLQMIPMSHLIGQFNILGPQGVHFWRKCWNKVGEWSILLKNQVFRQILSTWSMFFSYFPPVTPKYWIAQSSGLIGIIWISKNHQISQLWVFWWKQLAKIAIKWHIYTKFLYKYKCLIMN